MIPFFTLSVRIGLILDIDISLSVSHGFFLGWTQSVVVEIDNHFKTLLTFQIVIVLGLNMAMQCQLWMGSVSIRYFLLDKII